MKKECKPSFRLCALGDKEINGIKNEIEDESKELLKLKMQKKRVEDRLFKLRKHILWTEQLIQRNKNIINNN